MYHFVFVTAQESLSASQEVIRGLSYQQMSDHVDELAVEMKSNTNTYPVTTPVTANPPPVIHPAPSAVTAAVHTPPPKHEDSAVISVPSAVKSQQTAVPPPTVTASTTPNAARIINNVKQTLEVAVVHVTKASSSPEAMSKSVPPPVTSINNSTPVTKVAVAVAVAVGTSINASTNHLPAKALVQDSAPATSPAAVNEGTVSQAARPLTHRERERVRGREGRGEARFEGRGEGRVEGRKEGRGPGRGEYSEFRHEGRGEGRGYGRGEGRGRGDGRGHASGQWAGRGDVSAVNSAGPAPAAPHRTNALAPIQNPGTPAATASTTTPVKAYAVCGVTDVRSSHIGREGGHEGRGNTSGGRDSNKGRGVPQQSQASRANTSAPPPTTATATSTSTAQPEATGSSDSKISAAALADKRRNGFPAAKAGRGYGGQSSSHHLPINASNAPASTLSSPNANSATSARDSPQKANTATLSSNVGLGVNSPANAPRPFNQDRSNGFPQGQGHRQGQSNTPEPARPSPNSVNKSFASPHHNGSSSNSGRGYPNQGGSAANHHDGGGGGGRSSAGRGRGQGHGPGPISNPVNPLGNPRAPYGGVPAPRSGVNLMAAQSSPTSNSSGMS